MSKKLVTLSIVDEIELSHIRVSPDHRKLRKFLMKVGASKKTIEVWDKFISCQ